MQLVRLVSNQCDGLRERDMDQVEICAANCQTRALYCSSTVLYYFTNLETLARAL